MNTARRSLHGIAEGRALPCLSIVLPQEVAVDEHNDEYIQIESSES